MKLQHITFTGIDGKTDLGRLWEIQKEYPIAEFGVLVAKNWHDNGNRYFNPSYLESLDRGLNLSAHLCGSIARAAVRGDMEPWREWVRGNTYTPRFNRCQLNIATAAMQALITGGMTSSNSEKYLSVEWWKGEGVAKCAVTFADALIEELKKQGD